MERSAVIQDSLRVPMRAWSWVESCAERGMRRPREARSARIRPRSLGYCSDDKTIWNIQRC